ncbi:hypothetical protein K9M41_01770 [Candidatus Gracilibacteria bacterium]|nr:hypothetical protein [Candidatus Gracilibacteria bacterium]
MNKKLFFPVSIALVLFLFSLSVRAAWRADWNYPEVDTVYNPLSTEGFETIRFSGDFYDELSWEGFFYDPNTEEVILPSLIEVRFLQENIEPKVIVVQDLYPENEEDWTIAENLHIDEDGLSYAFEISIPADLFSVEENGNWIPQLHFEVAEPLNRGADLVLPDNRTIKIDTRSPEIRLFYNNDDHSLTNQPINVSISCNDGEDGSGCFPNSLNTISVKGNFHEDFMNENRGIEICDQVNNCTDFTQEDNKVQINFYDPIEPIFSGVKLKHLEGNIEISGYGESLAANDVFTFSITNPRDITSIDPEAYPNLFDLHACGEDNEDNALYFQQEKCASKEKRCARNAIIRNSIINQYLGDLCEFEPLPGDDPRLFDKCSESGHFPLCFPFNLHTSGDTLPFTLPFILSGD